MQLHTYGYIAISIHHYSLGLIRVSLHFSHYPRYFAKVPTDHRDRTAKIYLFEFVITLSYDSDL